MVLLKGLFRWSKLVHELGLQVIETSKLFCRDSSFSTEVLLDARTDDLQRKWYSDVHVRYVCL